MDWISLFKNYSQSYLLKHIRKLTTSKSILKEHSFYNKLISLKHNIGIKLFLLKINSKYILH